MIHHRKWTGRFPALVALMLAITVLAGCGQVPPDVAATRFSEAQKLEQDGNTNAALEAYQSASNGRFAQQAQALADMGRLAMDQDKYDVAIQAYTMLSQRHSEATVNAAPPGQTEETRVVSEWVGSATGPRDGGPLQMAEQAKDRINSEKIWYKLMDGIVASTGRNPWYSYVLALFVFTAVVKAAMTPLTKQQFHSMRKMSTIQPKMKALQDQLKDKPEELNRAVMKLYKDEGVNPLGCAGGMILQFPILIGLYSLIGMYKYRFRDGYFLWVNPETQALAPNVIGGNLAQPDMILLVLYAISMFVSQKLTVMPSADPQQRQQQMMMAYMMPVMFLFILKGFPSAFILYWLMFNVLTTWQQWHLMRMHPLETPAPAPATPAPAPKPRPATGPSRGPARTPAKRKKR